MSSRSADSPLVASSRHLVPQSSSTNKKWFAVAITVGLLMIALGVFGLLGLFSNVSALPPFMQSAINAIGPTYLWVLTAGSLSIGLGLLAFGVIKLHCATRATAPKKTETEPHGEPHRIKKDDKDKAEELSGGSTQTSTAPESEERVSGEDIQDEFSAPSPKEIEPDLSAAPSPFKKPSEEDQNAALKRMIMVSVFKDFNNFGLSEEQFIPYVKGNVYFPIVEKAKNTFGFVLEIDGELRCRANLSQSAYDSAIQIIEKLGYVSISSCG